MLDTIILQGPCALMDEVLVFRTKDCRFESCQGYFPRCARIYPSISEPHSQIINHHPVTTTRRRHRGRHKKEHTQTSQAENTHNSAEEEWGWGVRHVVLAPGSEDAMLAAVRRLVHVTREWGEGEVREIRGGNEMIGPIGLYLPRFQGAVPHPKPPCEAGAAAGLVT